jgi:hypothetical protein
MDSTTFRDVLQVMSETTSACSLLPSRHPAVMVDARKHLHHSGLLLSAMHLSAEEASDYRSLLPLLLLNCHTCHMDIHLQVVPALALAAAGQVAATALGQCASLLDEHGSTATLLARHAARSAAFYTGKSLSLHLHKCGTCDADCFVHRIFGIVVIIVYCERALDVISVHWVAGVIAFLQLLAAAAPWAQNFPCSTKPTLL